jgi:HEAT repeat protein
MAVSLEEVLAALAPEEPDYRRASGLGPEALPHLRQLVLSEDELLASKAASLAAFIGGPGAADVLEAASGHDAMSVRANAAFGADRLAPEQAEAMLLRLLDDPEPAVTKRAVKAAAAVGSDPLKARLTEISRESGRHEFVRRAALDALQGMP